MTKLTSTQQLLAIGLGLGLSITATACATSDSHQPPPASPADIEPNDGAGGASFGGGTASAVPPESNDTARTEPPPRGSGTSSPDPVTGEGPGAPSSAAAPIQLALDAGAPLLDAQVARDAGGLPTDAATTPLPRK